MSCFFLVMIKEKESPKSLDIKRQAVLKGADSQPFSQLKTPNNINL